MSAHTFTPVVANNLVWMDCVCGYGTCGSTRLFELIPEMATHILEEAGQPGNAYGPLYTSAEVAASYRVSRATVTRWASRLGLPTLRTLGSHHRYPELWVKLALLHGDDQIATVKLLNPRVRFPRPSDDGTQPPAPKCQGQPEA